MENNFNAALLAIFANAPEFESEKVLKYYKVGFSCHVGEQENGTWSVYTPISGEHDFILEQDAVDYASSYGSIDKRKK